MMAVIVGYMAGSWVVRAYLAIYNYNSMFLGCFKGDMRWLMVLWLGCVSVPVLGQVPGETSDPHAPRVYVDGGKLFADVSWAHHFVPVPELPELRIGRYEITYPSPTHINIVHYMETLPDFTGTYNGWKTITIPLDVRGLEPGLIRVSFRIFNTAFDETVFISNEWVELNGFLQVIGHRVPAMSRWSILILVMGCLLLGWVTLARSRSISI